MNSQTVKEESSRFRPFSPKHIVAGALVVALGAGIGTWQGLEHTSDGGSVSSPAVVRHGVESEAENLIASLAYNGVNVHGPQASTQDQARVDLGVSPATASNAERAPVDYFSEAGVGMGVQPGIASDVAPVETGVAPAGSDPMSAEAQAENLLASLAAAGIYQPDRPADPTTSAAAQAANLVASLEAHGVFIESWASAPSLEAQAAAENLIASLSYAGVDVSGY